MATPEEEQQARADLQLGHDKSLPLASIRTALRHLDNIESVYEKILIPQGHVSTLDYHRHEFVSINSLRASLTSLASKIREAQPASSAPTPAASAAPAPANLSGYVPRDTSALPTPHFSS